MCKKITREVETYYKLMIGDLEVSSIDRRGVVLCARNGGMVIHNNYQTCGMDEDYQSHEKRITDLVKELAKYGFKDVRIVEYKSVVENIRTDVELSFPIGGNIIVLVEKEDTQGEI